MAHMGKIAAVDSKTFTLQLAEPFGLVLDALGKTGGNVPFMMPARIAATPPEDQIKDVVGSGPFRFARDEWKPGEQVEYFRNSDYIPRDEVPSGSTGGKKVYLDKVIWRYTADPWNAAEDLAAGGRGLGAKTPPGFLPQLLQKSDLRDLFLHPPRAPSLAPPE